jgi:hypothetical protein
MDHRNFKRITELSQEPEDHPPSINMIKQIVDAKYLWEHISLEHSAVSDIIKQFKYMNMKFVDPDFPPT